MNYVYRACNPTILNLSINNIKDKFRIVGLQAQTIYTLCLRGLCVLTCRAQNKAHNASVMWAGAERSTANRSGVNVVEVVARNEFHRLWNVSGFVGGRR